LAPGAAAWPPSEPGALALSDIARSIEHGARQKTVPDPVDLVAQLAREFHRVESALRGFLG
jgi:hypothetical protein